MQRAENRIASDGVQPEIIHLVRPVADVGAGKGQRIMTTRAQIELVGRAAEEGRGEGAKLGRARDGIGAEVIEIIETVAKIGGADLGRS